MEKSEQELIDIADRMLANLQKQYWQTQQQNINFDKQCPENNENLHEDYQLLDADDQNNEPNDSNSEEEEGNSDENQEKNDNNKTEDNIAPSIVKPPTTKEAEDQLQNGVGELMEVFPTEEWVPQQKEVNINSEKIKQFTLKMNLPIPDWVNNEDMLKNRIMELFGKK